MRFPQREDGINQGWVNQCFTTQWAVQSCKTKSHDKAGKQMNVNICFISAVFRYTKSISAGSACRDFSWEATYTGSSLELETEDEWQSDWANTMNLNVWKSNHWLLGGLTAVSNETFASVAGRWCQYRNISFCNTDIAQDSNIQMSPLTNDNFCMMCY